MGTNHQCWFVAHTQIKYPISIKYEKGYLFIWKSMNMDYITKMMF
jgi:hypothetical protein